MPRFAAIDVGSNALRLRIIDATTPTKWKDIANSRAAVRLGSEVFTSGLLSSELITRVCATLREFRTELDNNNVEAYRALATSAVREASNSRELSQRVMSEAGIDLEIISGSEEARLVEIAVIRHVALQNANALLIDVGGGSTEVTLMEQGARGFSVSLPLGTIRLLATIQDDGSANRPLSMERLQEVVRAGWKTVSSRMTRTDIRLMVGTGGTVDTMFSLCQKTIVPDDMQSPSIDDRQAPPPFESDSAPQRIDTRLLSGLLKQMARLSTGERATTFGLKRDRVDTIIPGIAIVSHIAESLGYPPLTAPGIGLREGILEDLVSRYFQTGTAEDPRQ